jgi:hypothetical protein
MKAKNNIVTWRYAHSSPSSVRNDEEVIKINMENFKDGYIFVYLYSDDFEPHLGRFDAIKAGEYRLSDAESDANFIKTSLGDGYHDMFGVNPDDLRSKPIDPDSDEDQKPQEKLISAVGCFILYHSKGNLLIDHLNSSVYDRIREDDLLERVRNSLPETNCSGDFKGLQAYWSAMLAKKRSSEGESKKRQPQVALVASFLQRTTTTMTILSKLEYNKHRRRTLETSRAVYQRPPGQHQS